MIANDRNARWLNLGGIAILVLVELETVQRHPRTLIPTAITTAVAIVAWLLWWLTLDRDEWVRLAILTVLGASTIGLALASPTGASIIPAVVACAAASRLPGRVGAPYAATFIVAFVIANSYAIGLQLVGVVSYALGLSFAYLAARSTARLRQEQARTKQLLVELQHSRDAQVEAAALGERARIAREIHDVLAHTLSALTVQLEGARVMLEQRHSDPDALASVERALRLSREGLDETKRAVSALRGDQIPGTARLQSLVEDFQRDTGVSAHLDITGSARELPSDAQLALYRTAQEALTNVRKHARPQRVEVVLRYEPDWMELVILDHAPAQSNPRPSGFSLPLGGRVGEGVNHEGYGLIGMRERAELLGGTLDAHPTEDGFVVTLRLPV